MRFQYVGKTGVGFWSIRAFTSSWTEKQKWLTAIIKQVLHAGWDLTEVLEMVEQEAVVGEVNQLGSQHFLVVLLP